MNRLIKLMFAANHGRIIAIIGDSLPMIHLEVGDGRIYFRNYSIPSLRTIRVDTVWFVDPPPAEVKELGLQMLCLATKPIILEGGA